MDSQTDNGIRPDHDPPPPPPSKLRLIERHAAGLGLVFILLVGVAFRAWLAIQPRLGHLPDTDFFVGWSRSLHQHGLHGFYQANHFCDYPPFSLLTMWAVGNIAALFEAARTNDEWLRAMLKAPACLADLLIAAILFIEGRRLFGARRATAAAALYFLNPLSLYNSAYWGQVDAIHTAFVLLAVVLVSRGRFGAAGGAVTLALLQKFQSIAFVPLILFEAYRCRRWRGLGVTAVGATVVAAWVLLPFAVQGVLRPVLQRAYVGVVGQYTELSPSAYNVWYLTASPQTSDTIVPLAVVYSIADGRISLPADASPLLWLTWRRISLIVYATVVALILSIYSYRPGPVARTAAAGMLGFAFFLLPTEMHERYAHPAVALLAVWAVTGRWKERCYWMLSVLLLLNLTSILPVDDVARHVAAALVGLFVLMIGWVAVSNRFSQVSEESLPETGTTVEPVIEPPWLVRWFRRATYLATLAVVVIAAVVMRTAAHAPTGPPDDGVLYLSELEPVSTRQSWRTPQMDRSVMGGVIRLGDTYYLRGIGTHAESELTLDVPEGYGSFRALVGVDASAEGKGTVIASVELDGTEVFKTPLMTGRSQPIEVHVPLNGARRITLRALATNDGVSADHTSWALARFEKP